jgi:hypothetical protein
LVLRIGQRRPALLYALFMSTTSVLEPRRALRFDKLLPGDVVLASFKDAFSKLIVKASGNDDPNRHYSHAALVVDRYLWFEATSEGNGVTLQRLTKIEHEDGEDRTLRATDEYEAVEVFRHPDLNIKDRDQYLTAARIAFAACREFLGMQYPSQDATSRIPWLAADDRIKKTFERLIRNYANDEVVNPGAFCAELVVYAYGALKEANLVSRPLLRVSDKQPFEVSPNDLADSRISNLLPIPEAVCHERPDLPDYDQPGLAKYRKEDWIRLGDDAFKLLVDLKKEAKRRSLAGG